jgi:hypothetical protein
MNGNILIVVRDIQERWKEHFGDVLNREPAKRPARIEKERINNEIWSEEISEAEIKSVLKKLQNNKAPGIDNRNAES